jgi:hypothetical protein
MVKSMRFPTVKFYTVKFYIVGVRCLLFALVLQLSLIGVTQASALQPMEQRSDDCTTVMQPGWRPYRVQAVDTLETLVARTDVSLTQVMQVNCLRTNAVSPDDLLLLPLIAKVEAPVTIIEQSQSEASATINEALTTVSEAPATVNEADLATAPALITVISTTEMLATQSAAAPELSNAIAPVALPVATGTVDTANLIALALFVLVGLGIFFFALRPRADDSPMVRNLFNTMGNAVFLFAGVLVGVILFPMVNVASFSELPTGVSAGIFVSLIALLVAKELFFSGQQWRTMNRLLNLGIAPLLMIFFLTVASRVAEKIN